jgi:hypothetical protein
MAGVCAVMFNKETRIFILVKAQQLTEASDNGCLVLSAISHFIHRNYADDLTEKSLRAFELYCNSLMLSLKRTPTKKLDGLYLSHLYSALERLFRENSTDTPVLSSRK